MHSDESYEESADRTRRYIADLQRLAREDIPALFERGDLDEVLEKRIRHLIETGQLDSAFVHRVRPGEVPYEHEPGPPLFSALRRRPILSGIVLFAVVAAAASLLLWLQSRPPDHEIGEVGPEVSTVIATRPPAPDGRPSGHAEISAFVSGKFRDEPAWFGILIDTLRRADLVGELSAQVDRWERGAQADTDRIRRAMIQLFLAERGEYVDRIDGLYRPDCGGGSCARAWEWWRREAPAGDDVPPLPSEGAEWSAEMAAGLADFENVLIYRRVDGVG